MITSGPVTIAGVDVVGLDPAQLAALRSSRVDHGGNPVEPFVDPDAGWPLRCCLTDSRVGDELAIVAWSPFPWRGPYAEVGPIVVHVADCGGRTTADLPPQFLSRPQIVRPYGDDRRIAYDRTVLVEPDGSLPEVLEAALAHEEVDFVLVRNVGSGCYSFTAQRSSRPPSG